MTKEKVIRENVFDLDGNLVGWFDRAKAERFGEATRWDGGDHISIATGSQWDHEALYRTAGGRWVLNTWSQNKKVPERHIFISDDQAREWLLLNQKDEAAEKYFGDIEDERGPGRPEIGPAVMVRLPEDLLTALDRRAEGEGVYRAEMIRRLLSDVIEDTRETTYTLYDRVGDSYKELTEEKAQAIMDDAGLHTGPYGAMGHGIDQVLYYEDEDGDEGPMVWGVRYRGEWFCVPDELTTKLYICPSCGRRGVTVRRGRVGGDYRCRYCAHYPGWLFPPILDGDRRELVAERMARK